MEFGGKKGEILTFASYAQKDKPYEELTFCGYISSVFGHCFYCLKRCITCSYCDDCVNGNNTIQNKKSHAYEETIYKM